MDNRKEGSDLGVAPETVAGPTLQVLAEDGSGLSAHVPNAGLLLMRHALGLDDEGVPGPHGEFRNHFVTGMKGDDFGTCEELVRRGLMARRRYGFDEVNPSWIYHATEAGKEQARAKATTPNT